MSARIKSNDQRFMQLAGARLKPPGEFIAHTLPHLALAWLIGLCAIPLNLLPLAREFVDDAGLSIPFLVLVCLFVLASICANYYFAFLSGRQDLDTLYDYSPAMLPRFAELLAAAVIAWAIFIVASDVYHPHHEASPAVLLMLSYPFAAVAVMLYRFRACDLPHIVLALQAWAYGLAGVPPTHTQTLRDIRELAYIQGANHRQAFLFFLYAFFSFFLQWYLLEAFEMGRAVAMSLWYSPICLASTVAVFVAPIALECEEATVPMEHEEFEELQSSESGIVMVVESASEVERTQSRVRVSINKEVFDQFAPSLSDDHNLVK